jgi:hypothetical protein
VKINVALMPQSQGVGELSAVTAMLMFVLLRLDLLCPYLMLYMLRLWPCQMKCHANCELFGVGRAIFETDCSNLQRAMTTTDYDLSSVGVLIGDLKFRIRISFTEASVVFSPRICNKPAHELAALV